MDDEKPRVTVNGEPVEDAKVVVQVEGEPPTELADVRTITYANEQEHPAIARLRKMRGRRLTRMAIASRHKVYPPGSSWKRRDGSLAFAGPKYGSMGDP